jgi:hypothetical protein
MPTSFSGRSMKNTKKGEWSEYSAGVHVRRDWKRFCVSIEASGILQGTRRGRFYEPCRVVVENTRGLSLAGRQSVFVAAWPLPKSDIRGMPKDSEEKKARKERKRAEEGNADGLNLPDVLMADVEPEAGTVPVKVRLSTLLAGSQPQTYRSIVRKRRRKRRGPWRFLSMRCVAVAGRVKVASL